MLARPKRTGVYFYYCGTDRKEVPLGKDKDCALRRYHEIHTNAAGAAAIPAGFSLTLFRQTVKRAKKCEIPMSLTESAIEKMIASQDGRCAVTGIKFSSNVYPGSVFVHGSRALIALLRQPDTWMEMSALCVQR
jgi:hypothetical protein